VGAVTKDTHDASWISVCCVNYLIGNVAADPFLPSGIAKNRSRDKMAVVDFAPLVLIFVEHQGCAFLRQTRGIGAFCNEKASEFPLVFS
jgi:hypothetical protein